VCVCGCGCGCGWPAGTDYTDPRCTSPVFELEQLEYVERFGSLTYDAARLIAGTVRAHCSSLPGARTSYECIVQCMACVVWLKPPADCCRGAPPAVSIGATLAVTLSRVVVASTSTARWRPRVQCTVVTLCGVRPATRTTLLIALVSSNCARSASRWQTWSGSSLQVQRRGVSGLRQRLKTAWSLAAQVVPAAAQSQRCDCHGSCAVWVRAPCVHRVCLKVPFVHADHVYHTASLSLDDIDGHRSLHITPHSLHTVTHTVARNW
jgi:hypothetical protein